jgi:hypothetical protein
MKEETTSMENHAGAENAWFSAPFNNVCNKTGCKCIPSGVNVFERFKINKCDLPQERNLSRLNRECKECLQPFGTESCFAVQ